MFSLTKAGVAAAMTFGIISVGFAGGADQLTSQRSNFFVTANVGAMVSSFKLNSNMISDSVSPDISTNTGQTSFLGGAGLGYLSPINSSSFWGVELSGAGSTGTATYSDTRLLSTESIANRAMIDLDAIFGVKLTQKASAFMKIGPSTAYVKDTINSPTGLFATNTTTTDNKWMAGLNFAVGLSQDVSDSWFVFSEYDFHYFPQTAFANFPNHMADYTRSNSLTANAVSVGVGMHI